MGWDGADWKIASPLLDAGEMPQLANIVLRGASGPLASIPPYLSPMLWNSIATGKYADQHGIVGFASSDLQTGRLQPMQSTQRRCKALWNILSEHGLKTNMIGWFASHPAENIAGICVSEALSRGPLENSSWTVPPGSVHPAELAEDFAALRLRSEEVDPVILRLFIPRLAEIDPTRDRRPALLARRLAELYTVHNCAIAALDREPCDFLGVYYHFIDWICHDFMDFHPPIRPQVPEREFEWYRDVVSSAYRLQDLLLRDLLAHAGPDSTLVLCSDHGFHSDSRRPSHIPMVSAGIAIWHRAQGIFGAAGPGIAHDTLIEGATVLDVTPTILHLLGLPAARDMDGRVLTSALCDPSSVRTVESYELDAGTVPRSRHLHALTHDDQKTLLEQFAALGYIELSCRGPASSAQQNDQDNRWNLSLTLRHAGRHEAALALLHSLHLERPEDARYAFHLAMCQLHLGLANAATLTQETLLDYTPGNAQASLLLAEIYIAAGAPEAALEELERASMLGVHLPGYDSLRGSAFLKQNRMFEAAVAFRAAVEADTENPAAWLGYSQALLAAGQIQDAEACAREAIALAPSLGGAYLVLGRALAAQGQESLAKTALDRALELNPRLLAARRIRDRLGGLPFVAATADLSAEVFRQNTVERLKRELDERSARHIQNVATLRSRTAPCTLYEPPTRPHFIAAAQGGSEPAAPAPFVIVSGLPRSGTSLMMQMLARGGLEPMTDHRRAADESNPIGYFEWEEIKELPRNPTLITRAAGHAIKIVSPLLAHLPGHHRYKIIFMLRPVAEIALSQLRMLNRKKVVEPTSLDQLQPLLARHLAAVLDALRTAQNVSVLTVDYPSLISRPHEGAKTVADFVGRDLLPTSDAMFAAVEPHLYRHRAAHL